MASNIARVRKSQRISLQELETRLTDIGHRISFSGLSKIERGERRVDVDDLMALAVVLDVSPLGLLLPVDQEPSELVDVTGATGSLGLFWVWSLAVGTYFTRDSRAFVSRSIPWWVDTAGTDINWYGELDLSIAPAGKDLAHVARMVFSARTAADLEDRPSFLAVEDHEHPEAP